MAIPFVSTGTIDALDEIVALDYRVEEPNNRRFNGAAGVQVVGTFSGTLNVEITRDGTTYAAIQALNEATGMLNTTISAAGIYRVELVGAFAVRVKATAWTSGTASVHLVAVEG